MPRPPASSRRSWHPSTPPATSPRTGPATSPTNGRHGSSTAFGSPEQTQRFVRAIADSEYADAPVDEPGNDDLGALSSWYVWAALGLFPVTPGLANLSLASPLFPSVDITLPNGRHLVERAPEAAASGPYVHALTVSGVRPPAARRPAAAPAAPPAAGSGTSPGCRPPPSAPAGPCTTPCRARRRSWASSPEDAPPSYGTGQLPAVGFSRCRAAPRRRRSESRRHHARPGPAGTTAATVHWQAHRISAGWQ